MLRLSRCPALVRCNLSCNQLTVAGLKAAMECVGPAATLAELDVHGNMIDSSMELQLMLHVDVLKAKRMLPPHFRLHFNKP